MIMSATLNPTALRGLFILTFTAHTLGHQGSKGCTASQILPDKPFFVVWNHPTSICEAIGINLNFNKWGIVDNSKDNFIGEQIALLYSPGQFPYYSGDTAYNGGLPQLGNLSSHLMKIQTDILMNIPSASFSGLGVIDFESWRPIFDLNYDALKIYQLKSIELAKQKFPGYNSSKILQEARHEFEGAARPFLEKTLHTISLLRPNGKWGYYGYPRCWDDYCNSSTVEINDRYAWIYNQSTGLYPSIYFTRNVPEKYRASSIKKTLHETLRVKAKWSSQDTVILPYALCQDNAYDFHNQTDLSYSVGEPANMGSSGVVLWGSTSYMKYTRKECLLLQDYINSTLGPYTLQVTNFFANCTQTLCEGHGRCVRKDYERYYQYYLKKSGHTDCLISAARLVMRKNNWWSSTYNNNDSNNKYKVNKQGIFNFRVEETEKGLNMGTAQLMGSSYLEQAHYFDNYVCKCFAGWSGTHCEHKK